MGVSCFLCRTRKVRCDGNTPQCGQCSRARKPVSCAYPDPHTPHKPDILRKGAACIPCRQKKKKCDGKYPSCKTCCSVGKGDACYYSDNPQGDLLHRVSELEGLLRDRQTRTTGTSLKESSNSVLQSTVPTNSSFNDRPLQLTEREPSSSGAQLPPEVLMNMRKQFIAHCVQIGLCLTDDRKAVIEAGDLDTTQVHPVLIYGAQLWGCVADNTESHFSQLPVMAQLANMKKALEDTSLILDSTTALQGHQVLSMCYFAKRDVFRGREHLLKASHVALENNCRLVSRVQSITRDTTVKRCFEVILRDEEEIGAICQLLYMDLSQALLYGTPRIFPDDFIPELRILPQFYAVLSIDVFCCAARALSASYYTEARQLLSRWQEDGCCPSRSDMWYKQYHALMAQLKEHNIQVENRMKMAAMAPESHSHFLRVMKSALMLSLATLADLHFLLSPTLPDSRRSCAEVITEVIHMTTEFDEVDYEELDPMLSLVWSSCMNVIRFEMSSSPGVLPAIVIHQMLEVLRENSDSVRQRIRNKKAAFVGFSLDMITI